MPSPQAHSCREYFISVVKIYGSQKEKDWLVILNKVVEKLNITQFCFVSVVDYLLFTVNSSEKRNYLANPVGLPFGPANGAGLQKDHGPFLHIEDYRKCHSSPADR